MPQVKLDWTSVNLIKSSKELQAAFATRAKAHDALITVVTKALGDKVPAGKRVIVTGVGRETLSYALTGGAGGGTDAIVL